MRPYSYFPQKLPGAFLSLPGGDPRQPHRFFLDIARDRLWRNDLVNKLETYTEFFDDGGCDATGSEMRVLLLLGEWRPVEKSIQRFVRGQLSRLDSELRVFTSTCVAVSGNSTGGEIWTDVHDVDELVSFTDIAVNP